MGRLTTLLRLDRVNMRMGILEDKHMEQVPGTEYVLDDDSRRDESHATAQNPNLQYHTNKNGSRVILIPQPVPNDPNDPLNWPLWRRDLHLFILSLTAVIATTLSPILAANTLSLSLYFGRTFTYMALLTGYHLLGVAVAGFFFVPSSRIWGKRHAFLLGACIVIVSSAWAGASGNNYASLLWARIFQGVGLAPFEALVNATVGDLYFVHERGKRMAMTNFAVFGGSFLTPVIVGRMSRAIGYQWSFYFVAIFVGIMLPFVVFFLPETAYRRPEETGTELPPWKEEVERPESSATLTAPEVKPAAAVSKPSYWQLLKPFNGKKTDETFWKLILRPLPLFFHPGVLWACLIQGTLIGWTVFLGIVLAAIMLGPPLFFNEVRTGYMYTGAFIGAIVGFIISGLLADWSAAFLTRRNRGVYEPEFRMVLVLPQMILGCLGLFLFGFVAADTWKYGWFWPDFFFAFEVAGMVIGAVASSLYIVDAHRSIAIEAFTCMMIFKNIFSFGLTWSGYDWLVDSGIETLFYASGIVQAIVCLTTVPMYIFGKRNRSFFYRNDILKMLGLW